MKAGSRASFLCMLHFVVFLILLVLVTSSLQSSAPRTSNSGNRVDNAKSRIEKRSETGKVGSLHNSASKHIEKGSTRLQRLYQLTQKQAQERLQSTTPSPGRRQYQRHAQQEMLQKMTLSSNLQSQQGPLNKDSISDTLTPIDR